MLLAIRMRCLTSRNDLINIAVSDQLRRGRTVGDPHVTALNREVNRSNTMLCTTSVPLTPPYWLQRGFEPLSPCGEFGGVGHSV